MAAATLDIKFKYKARKKGYFSHICPLSSLTQTASYDHG